MNKFFTRHFGIARYSILLWVACILFPVTGRSEQPFQSWLMIGISQRLDYGLEPTLNVENDIADKSPTWRKIEITPELVWHYSPRYDFSVGYMYTYTDDVDGSHDSWNAGLFSGTVKLPIQRWYITSRQRFEFGDKQNKTTAMFRQLTRIEYKQDWLPWKMTPFIADEWFYDMEMDYLSENRVYGGVAYEINRSYMTEVFLMRQDMWTQNGDNMNGYVLGFGLNLKF